MIFFRIIEITLETLLLSFFEYIKKIILSIFFVLSFIILYYFQFSSEITGKTIIQIPKKARFSSVQKILEEKKLVSNSTLFKIFSRYKEYDRKIKSGEFSVPIGLNEWDLVEFLLTAKPEYRKITIVEGLRFSKIAQLLSKKLNLNDSVFLDLFSNQKFLKKLNIQAKNLEGYLLPQTYLFEWGLSEKEVLKFLINQSQKILEENKKVIKKRNLSTHEILTMASIIQGECIYEDEMSLVSSVYWNRIRIGYKLQADPTIQYFLNKPTRLLFKHLKIEHPYNTYLNEGLPPGPINNPGKEAILAAIYPTESKYLYFVADGKGRHIFGKTLIEHNENRKKLDSLRRKLARERRRAKK